MTLVAVAAISMAAQAKTVKTTFKVGGNCELCEKRIEKAAMGVKGVVAASWNQRTKVLALNYDNKQTDVKTVQKAIAAVGHDAGPVKASDEVYNKLHGCCKYRK